jgi:hypothetical protein
MVAQKLSAAGECGLFHTTIPARTQRFPDYIVQEEAERR